MKPNLKYKVVFAKYDPKLMLSRVTIQTNIGKFDGYCKVHESDKEYASEFTGVRYAEQKALMKYIHKMYQRSAAQLQGFAQVYNRLFQIKKYPGWEKVKQCLQECLEGKEKERNIYKEYEKTLKKELKSQIAFDDNFHKSRDKN